MPRGALRCCKQARSAAKRPDEKKQALGKIGQIPTPEALQAVMADLSDPGLANEAGLAAMTIAEKLAASNPKLASETAAKVLAQCKTPKIVKRAWVIARQTDRLRTVHPGLARLRPLHASRASIGAEAVFERRVRPRKARRRRCNGNPCRGPSR